MKLSILLKQIGIQAALFDLDDTLVATHDIFNEHKKLLVSFLAKSLGIADEIMRGEYEAAFVTARNAFFVDPFPLWLGILGNLQAKYPLLDEELKYTCLRMVMNIYSQEPQPFTNALEVLTELRSNGIKVAIVSHAALDWTMFKLNSAGLSNAFDHLELASVNERKSMAVWLNAITALDVPASHCLAVGDNLQGDCEAALQAGAREVMLMRRADGWAYVNDGVVPPEVMVIGSLDEITIKLAEKYTSEFKLH